MGLKCKNCGAMNADGLRECGNCGSLLLEAVKVDARGPEGIDGIWSGTSGSSSSVQTSDVTETKIQTRFLTRIIGPLHVVAFIAMVVSILWIHTLEAPNPLNLSATREYVEEMESATGLFHFSLIAFCLLTLYSLYAPAYREGNH